MKRILSTLSILTLGLVMSAVAYGQTPNASCCQEGAACCQEGAACCQEGASCCDQQAKCCDGGSCCQQGLKAACCD